MRHDDGAPGRSGGGHVSANGGPAPIRVVEAPPGDPRWQGFVDAHPDGSVHHSEAWLKALEVAHGFAGVRLLCEDADGGVRGVLPLCHRRRLGRDDELSSLPYTPFAGPLGCDAEATAALVRAAVDHARARPRTHLQLKTSGPALDGVGDAFSAHPWDPTWVLRLPDDPDKVRFGDSRNHGRIRWSVNKAAKQGVVVRGAESEDDLRSWYPLYLEAMRWHAAPPRPYRFFEACWRLLGPRGRFRLLLAEHRGAAGARLVAGSIFLGSGATLLYAFNGRRRADLGLRPNDAIHWSAIHEACRQGFRWYDFGEVMEDNQGLAQFKSKWGAEPRALYRYRFPPQRGLGGAGSGRPGVARRLANGAWRRLPLGATAVLGDWMHSHL
jgi:hypothetical protein